ncbi:hypothetical protein, partial [Pseudomonas monteilii]|uniref:hypothetical protein n=1 Tax=Pseudomonas monteilii TaxID=76759 RepID=UPI001C710C12
ASSAAPPTPDALSNNAPHGSHFRPPTKTHRINSHDNYPDAAGYFRLLSRVTEKQLADMHN